MKEMVSSPLINNGSFCFDCERRKRTKKTLILREKNKANIIRKKERKKERKERGNNNVCIRCLSSVSIE